MKVAIDALVYALAAACFVLIAALPGNWVFQSFNLVFPIHTYYLAAIVSAALFVSFYKNPPQETFVPAVFIAAGCLGASVSINILPQLSLTFALIGFFGFTGLFPQWRDWWGRNIFPALLIALVLPFGVSSQTGFGFFMRVAVTDAAAQILHMFGMELVSSHDVLIFENNLARVDAPCSGLKSLFTGSAFFIAASTVLQRAMSFRWLLAYSLFLVFIITGNVTRIVVLVVMQELFQAPAVAELFHIPLGLLFFAMACAGGTGLLFLVSVRGRAEQIVSLQPRLFVGGLIALLGGFSALLASPILSNEPTQHPSIAAPMDGVYESLPLTTAEAKFFSSNPNTSVKKWRFNAGDLSGAILIVRSSAVTAMHAPEICFQANGFELGRMKTRQLSSSETLRELSLGETQRQAMYWMQSESTVTDSFITRLKRYAFKGEGDWVLVTILFDNEPALTSEMTIGYFHKVRQHVDGMLKEKRGDFND